VENLVYGMQRPSIEDGGAAAAAAPKAATFRERVLLVVLWLLVGVPMLWGVLMTLLVVQYLFR
jgi:hypothetical protein